MAEYIKRESLIAWLHNMAVSPALIAAIKNKERFPAADVVEVVRCRDCEFCKYNEDADVHKCDRRGFFTEYVNPDEDYCSRGKNKTIK